MWKRRTMFGWLRKRRIQPTIAEPDSEASSHKVVAECYNEARDFRCLVFEPDNGAYSYYFEFLMNVSEDVGHDFTEWTDMYLARHSGVYDTIETAINEAKRDSIWIQRARSA